MAESTDLAVIGAGPYGLSLGARGRGMATLARGPYACDLVTTVTGLAALEAEWDALHAAVKGAYVSDSFAWARLSWDLVGQERGLALCCAVVRLDSRVVAIWPLTVSRTAIWRVAASLSSRSSEYCPFLIDPAADLGEAWRSILREVRIRGAVDALHLLKVRDDAPLARCLSMQPGAARMDSAPAPFLRRADFADWPSYHAGLPQSLRAKLRRDKRRLEQLGTVRFQELSDPAERQSVWSWMIANKRRWLVRHGLRSDWMFSEGYARFVAASLDRCGPSGARRIFALKVDEAVVATDLVSVDQTRVESFVGTFDEEYARCAPGNVLRDETIRWAFAQGLDYDCRLGAEPYKQHFANQVAYVANYAFPLTVRGRLFVIYEVTRRWIARKLPDPVRKRVAAVLRRARTKRRSNPPDS